MKTIGQSGLASTDEKLTADENLAFTGLRGALSRLAFRTRALGTPDQNRSFLAACALLLVLSTALFHRALDFRPADAVDLRLFSVATHTSNPLKYLVGDWGEAPYETGHYGLYRPLHPISLWIVYKLFGARSALTVY